MTPKKHILVLHQHFKTLEEVGSTRLLHLVEIMLESNYQVTVIRGGCRFTDSQHPLGFRLITLKVEYDQKMGILKRFSSFISFIFKALVKSLGLKGIDLCYASSTPLTIGLPAMMLKWIKRIPFVFEVRDLWPDVPIQLRGIKNSYLIRLAYFLESIIYKSARHIVVASPDMKDNLLKKGIKPNKITVITNFSNPVFYEQSPSIPKDKVNIIYFGAIGLANGLDSFFQFAEYALVNRPNYCFFILGEGALKTKFHTLYKKLDNLKWMDSIPKENTPLLLKDMHFNYISFADYPILATSSPNKFFDGLAIGLHPIINFKGWIYDLLLNEEMLIFDSSKEYYLLCNTIDKVILSYDYQIIKTKQLYKVKFDINNYKSQFIKILNDTTSTN